MRTTLMTLCCLLPVAAVMAQEAKAPPGAKEYDALVAEYETANKAWTEKITAASKAKDKAAVDQLLAARVEPAFRPRFQALATAHKGTDAAIPCLVWLVMNGYGQGEVTKDAVQELVRAHAEAPAIGEVLPNFRYLANAKDHDLWQQWCSEIARRNPDQEVKAKALFARGGMCIGTTGSAPSEAARAAAIVDITKAIELSADAKFKAAAQEAIDEENLLGVGKLAPDIEGEDLDGVAFKLSDYRGKVVMLDFWGDW